MFIHRGGFIGWGAFLLLAVYANRAYCAEIEISQVTHNDGTYLVKFVALLEASPEQVFKAASDFKNYNLLSPSVTKSEIVEYRPSDQLRVKLSMRSCVVMFCKTLYKVSEVNLTPISMISFIVIPSLSSFEEMSEELVLVRVPERKTRLHYIATVDPDFFIPPVIGPWLAEKFIKRELTISTQRIELEARKIKP